LRPGAIRAGPAPLACSKCGLAAQSLANCNQLRARSGIARSTRSTDLRGLYSVAIRAAYRVLESRDDPTRRPAEYD